MPKFTLAPKVDDEGRPIAEPAQVEESTTHEVTSPEGTSTDVDAPGPDPAQPADELPTPDDYDAWIETSLDIARDLIRAGIPVGVAKRCMRKGEWDPAGGHGGIGYWLPNEWEKIEPHPAHLDHWKEGDLLFAVMGHTADLLDVDPRHGGEESYRELEAEGKLPRGTGLQRTPSGGFHKLIAPLRLGSDNGARPGIDIKSGQDDGEGRGLMFLAPSIKMVKATGQLMFYYWTERPDVASLAGDTSGEALAEEIRARRHGQSVEVVQGRELEHPYVTGGDMSAKVAETLAGYQTALEGGDARHDAMRDTVWDLVWAGSSGEPGVRKALETIKEWFDQDVGGGRTGELMNAIRGAIRKITAKQGTDKGEGRRLRIQKASEIRMRATRWLWNDDGARWIPVGALVLMAGREGVGKSTIVYLIAAKITRGELPGHFQGTPRSVIISATEDAWEQTVVPRLAACGADLDRVFRVDAVTPDGFPEAVKLPEDLGLVESLIRVEDVALVLLDPLMGSISGTLDSHKDQDLRHALEPVSRLASEAQVSVLGLIHENKAGGADIINRIMGSRAFAAVARGVLYAARDQEVPQTGDRVEKAPPPHEMFLFGQPKNNLDRKVPFTLRYHIEGTKVGHDEELDEPIYGSRIVWDGKVEDQLQDIVNRQEAELRAPDKETAQDRAADWLEEYLESKPEGVTSSIAKEAGKRAGHADRTLQRVLTRVGVVVSSCQTDRGRETVWSLLGATGATPSELHRDKSGAGATPPDQHRASRASHANATGTGDVGATPAYEQHQAHIAAGQERDPLCVACQARDRLAS